MDSIPRNGIHRPYSSFPYYEPRREDGTGSRLALEGFIGLLQGHEASLAFSSVDALERYMNEVRRCLFSFQVSTIRQTSFFI